MNDFIEDLKVVFEKHGITQITAVCGHGFMGFKEVDGINEFWITEMDITGNGGAIDE